jgi:hypothetical protein
VAAVAAGCGSVASHRTRSIRTSVRRAGRRASSDGSGPN